MTESAKEKAKFRTTTTWKDFRQKMRKERKVDAITGKPLSKSYNLHHCDMSDKNYTNLEEENFECLNSTSHDIIHFLFRYSNWREILQNIARILEKMEKLNS